MDYKTIINVWIDEECIKTDDHRELIQWISNNGTKIQQKILDDFNLDVQSSMTSIYVYKFYVRNIIIKLHWCEVIGSITLDQLYQELSERLGKKPHKPVDFN